METGQPAAPAAQPGPSTAAEIGRLIRPLAALGFVALILGRVVAPALRGAFVGMDSVIRYTDAAAGILSQGLAFAVTALSVGALLMVARDRQVPVVVRAMLIPQTALVLLLGIWATRKALPNPGAILVGLMAAVAALFGSIPGFRQGRTRALAVVLSITGLACLVRVAGALVAMRGSSLAFLSATLSSVAVIVHAAALLVALVWLASRRRTLVPPATMAVLIASVALTWAAARGSQPGATAGWVFVWRALDSLLPRPVPSLPASVAVFLAVLSPALALAALATRRQIPSVIGALALTLLAGILADAPVQAMLLTLAALSTVLASRDDRGMWEALLGRPLRPGTPAQDR